MNVKLCISLHSESSRCMMKTLLFAILFRKQKTDLLNITTSAVTYTEGKYGLTFKRFVCRWRIAICKRAYTT